jgi:hypothetical protein
MNRWLATAFKAAGLFAAITALPLADATASAACGWGGCWRPCMCWSPYPFVYEPTYRTSYRPLHLYKTSWGAYRPRGFFAPIRY